MLPSGAVRCRTITHCSAGAPRSDSERRERRGPSGEAEGQVAELERALGDHAARARPVRRRPGQLASDNQDITETFLDSVEKDGDHHEWDRENEGKRHRDPAAGCDGSG